MKKKTTVTTAVVAALVLSVGCVTAFAVESDAFSYLAGRQHSTSRNELYAQAAELPEDKQNAFLAANGIADTPYSEEAAVTYSYVTGQQVGSLYEDDTEDKAGYSYTTGQEAGASYAPESEEDEYSYLAGQQNSASRNELYAQAEELPEEEQDVFLVENGIGETPYSEEAAASYSYVTGQQVGSLYEDDTEDKTGYSYTTGQEAGASYAPESEEDEYSYLAGQQNSTSRNELYAQAEELPEEEQDAFLAENGIGETPYSEEAAASYGYVGGQQRGASYRQGDDDGTWDMSGYSYQAGQQRGASYHK